MNDSHTLKTIKNELTDTILVGAAILAVFQLFNLLYFKSTNIIEDRLFPVRILIQVLFIGLFLIRKQVPHSVKAWVVVSGGLVAGITSTLSFGTSAGGLLILFVVVLISMILLSNRVAFGVLITSLVPLIYQVR